MKEITVKVWLSFIMHTSGKQLQGAFEFLGKLSFYLKIDLLLFAFCAFIYVNSSILCILLKVLSNIVGLTFPSFPVPSICKKEKAMAATKSSIISVYYRINALIQNPLTRFLNDSICLKSRVCSKSRGNKPSDRRASHWPHPITAFNSLAIECLHCLDEVIPHLQNVDLRLHLVHLVQFHVSSGIQVEPAKPPWLHLTIVSRDSLPVSSCMRARRPPVRCVEHECLTSPVSKHTRHTVIPSLRLKTRVCM